MENLNDIWRRRLVELCNSRKTRWTFYQKKSRFTFLWYFKQIILIK